jgi:hypothetical protein
VTPFELFGRNFCLATLQHHFLNSLKWGLGGGGGSIHSQIHIWRPHVAKSPQKPTIPEILEKS